ncbi:MAG TPA: Hsp20 family protein [Candidatus Acidoferrales bacterium]|nr:Hsp20 family protein [Candidatus Acidoferrales bacterium]
MQAQGSARQMQPAPEQPVKVRIGGLTDEIKGTFETIGRRAFDIFERKGRALGHALTDWLEAEAEFLHPVRLELLESDESYRIRAEVPGFSVRELDVRIEPQRVTITGSRETAEEKQIMKRVYSEWSSNRILRTIELPAEVNTESAKATLKDGILELDLLKATPGKRVPIETRTA